MDPLTVAFLAGIAVAAVALVLGRPARVVAGADGDAGAGAGARDASTRTCPRCGAANDAGYDYCRDCVGSLETV
jgi:ribosomal protein L40E